MIVELELDLPRIGCGRRLFVVVRTGRKLVRLLAVGSLQAVTISKTDMARSAPSVPTNTSAHRVTRTLTRQRRLYRRLALPFAARDVAAAIAALKGAS